MRYNYHKKRNFKDMAFLFKFIIALSILLVLSCTSQPPRYINLMPTPEVYDENNAPFTNDKLFRDAPYKGMLYATDRAPELSTNENTSATGFYTSERGHLLRLGVAKIEHGDGEFSWEEARRISLAKNRTTDYPLSVTKTNELGIYDGSYHPFLDKKQLALISEQPAKRFAELINQKLAISENKDINIYVHGYKVNFDNAILVSTELWHYLGYEGVFVAFSWPATPERLAYFADAETTISSAYIFRRFLRYLAQETNAENINIVGYSQGTRLVADVLHNMALKYHDETREQTLKKLRIGQVILIGSDIDKQVMATYIVDGLLKIPKHLTLYVSEKDSALSLSQFFYRRSRLGQMFKAEEMSASTLKFLTKTPELSVINVTDAEGATNENGHRYFRKSPWASSDILMTLRHNLSPAERGLIRTEDNPVWSFPADYISRLRKAIAKANPE